MNNEPIKAEEYWGPTTSTMFMCSRCEGLYQAQNPKRLCDSCVKQDAEKDADDLLKMSGTPML